MDITWKLRPNTPFTSDDFLFSFTVYKDPQFPYPVSSVMVIIDQAVPELFGDQLAMAIKEESSSTPIILITGFGDLIRTAKEQSTGPDVVVSKPIRFGKFRETVASVVPVGLDFA